MPSAPFRKAQPLHVGLLESGSEGHQREKCSTARLATQAHGRWVRLLRGHLPWQPTAMDDGAQDSRQRPQGGRNGGHAGVRPGILHTREQDQGARCATWPRHRLLWHRRRCQRQIHSRRANRPPLQHQQGVCRAQVPCQTGHVARVLVYRSRGRGAWSSWACRGVPVGVGAEPTLLPSVCKCRAPKRCHDKTGGVLCMRAFPVPCV